uniref:precorrin-8X methylmutase n=1 Tax=Lachnoclostridium phocaeense TaxID=1871021 RepID=UPI0026DB5405|nr:precorrin-8X methylmutase [Lachnoclostridium phocaeense]
MTEKLEQVLPENIEKRSFEIISQELGERSFDPLEEPVIKRCIHTSADFDYADTLVFSPGAVRRALEAVRSGALIVTDTNMGKAGVNKKVLASFGGETVCFMADPDVAKAAKEEGTTRAVASMKKAAALAEETDRPLILAVGNAPTALVEICALLDQGKIDPVLVIGVPVGFVNVVAAKEMLLEKDVPSIVARGRKGGSNIAAAICNAILYMARDGVE